MIKTKHTTIWNRTTKSRKQKEVQITHDCVSSFFQHKLPTNGANKKVLNGRQTPQKNETKNSTKYRKWSWMRYQSLAGCENVSMYQHYNRRICETERPRWSTISYILGNNFSWKNSPPGCLNNIFFLCTITFWSDV